MSYKAVGTIKNTQTRTTGKIYQAERTTVQQVCMQKVQKQDSKLSNQRKCNSRNRSNSVGRIYTTKTSSSKQHLKKGESPMRPGKLINYNEIENKLSLYLESTINTSSRKYNYLPKNQTPLKEITKINTINNASEQKQKKFVSNQFDKNVQIDKKTVRIFNQAQVKGLIKSNSQVNGKNKENIQYFSSMNRKESICGLSSLNHHEYKSELQNKLKKMIDNYQTKNKQLSLQMHKLQVKPQTVAKQKQLNGNGLPRQQDKNVAEEKDCPHFSNQELNETFNKLTQFSLKGICLTAQCDPKLQQIWRSIHHQIVLNQNLRIIKCFINQENIANVVESINANKLKKIEATAVKIQSQQYDPFLLQKFNQNLNTKQKSLNTKNCIKWISENFIKHHEQSQRHWIKFLSQEKIECTIRTMVLQKEITGLRKTEASGKDLNLRDFTRYLSTLYKANLRNRNVSQIHNKLKGMSYAGRFTELLEEKTGRSNDQKKNYSDKK